MNKTSGFGRIGSVLATFGAVLDVARAIEARRQPAAGALKTLGIDEQSFRQIHLG